MAINTISRIQIPTWKWLKINASQVEFDPEGRLPYQGDPIRRQPEGVVIRRCFPEDTAGRVPQILAEIRDKALAWRNYGLIVEIPAGMHIEEPCIFDFSLDINSFLGDQIEIRAGKNSRATVVIRYASNGEKDAKCSRWGFIRLKAEQGSQIQVIKTQLLDKNSLNVDGFQAELEAGAHANVLLAELGGAKSVSACDISLRGGGSVANLDGLYGASGRQVLDLNYRIQYMGKDTQGFITVKGALAGEAKKNLKSTIDFLPGAHRAVGREEEGVLALSDRATNLSAPLLLCGEDNVEGQHATTTGKPNPEKLFYLMSRGLNRKYAKRLLVEAALSSHLKKIQPDKLREEVEARLQEVIHDGE